jgi:6-phosphogluconolactonase (cycloisomerase 2 family)
MRKPARAFVLGSALALVAVLAQPGVASAWSRPKPSHEHGVFVETNDPTNNQIVAYHRESDGTLGRSHVYDTHGKGGQLGGAPSDPLGSQGALTYDAAHHILLAVNAGSGTLSVFRVNGEKLHLHQVIDAGAFPVSVAVHDDLVYVLDAGGAGAVRGYHVHGATLRAIAGSGRSLSLAAPPSPDMAFLFSPGQVAFSPDGQHVLVTTKMNGHTIDVYAVQPDGRLSADARKNASQTPVPFALLFDHRGHLLVGEAGTSSLTTYALDDGGVLTPLTSLSDGQTALCWLVEARGFFFVANTGSATISGFSEANGHLSLVDDTHKAQPAPGVVATTSGGTIDLAAAAEGSFLYAESGAHGTVDAYRVRFDGTLRHIDHVGGFGALGLEGIATS